jgi:hypothetical protein
VPLIVAYVGFLIQQSVAKQTTAKDYVALAVKILRADPKKDVESDPLRDWAVDVLVRDSPVKVSEAAETQLRSHGLAIDFDPNLPVTEDLETG